MRSSSIPRFLALAFLGSLLPLACSSRDEAPSPPVTESGARLVEVRVAQDSLGEHFPEGGGLIRRLPELMPAGEWWLARLAPRELEALTEAGIEWRERENTLTKPQEFTPMEGCSGKPAPNTFCAYDVSIPRCNRSIRQELDAAPAEFPPIAGVPYVQTIDFGTSHLGETIKAVRIGKLSPTTGPVPQYVMYAAQHSGEWIGPEMAMRTFRYFATRFRDNTEGVRDLLRDVAIVIVPVSNPDGYDYTQTTPADRTWRKNRQPCSATGTGTDINRNHEATFYQPGNGTSCTGGTYRGSAPRSAPESEPLLNLFANVGLPGSFVTRFALNVHAYGNVMLFPEGISAGAGMGTFSPCTTNSNCTAPDLGAFHDLMGTELHPTMVDEESMRPYVAGQVHRMLYSIGGDSISEHVYGNLPGGKTERFLGAGIELTHTGCGFSAENLPTGQLSTLATNFINLNRRIVDELPALHDGSFFGDFELPILHRRQPDGVAGEYPAIRVAARKHLTGVEFLVPGGTGAVDDVRDGVEYRMHVWRPEEPYKFPTLIPLCHSGQKCTPLAMGDPGWGSIHLCDPGLFPSLTGWSFVGDMPGGPARECFYKFDPSGAAPWQMTSGEWSIAHMRDARLVYSVEWSSGVTGRVLVSNNHFAGCSETATGSCRVVRSYPFGTSNIDLRNSSIRTEIIDISDFDHSGMIQLRFEATGGSGTFNVFDPIIIGWQG
jgi:hypothetical protein